MVFRRVARFDWCGARLKIFFIIIDPQIIAFYTFLKIVIIHITVKPEITHTLGGHHFLWVITGYGFSQV